MCGKMLDSTIGTAAVAEKLGNVLPTAILKEKALVFIFATTFNVPCVKALALTYIAVLVFL